MVDSTRLPEIDINAIATDLNGKADVDLTNLNDTGKIAIAHNAMPSTIIYPFTWGASYTEYTMPYDGYLHVAGESNTSQAYMSVDYKVNSTTYYTVSGRGTSFNNDYIDALVPVFKGMVIRIRYENMTLGAFCMFIAIVSESEV